MFKNKLKIFSIIFLIICIHLLSVSTVYALSVDGIMQGADNFIDAGNGGNKISAEGVKDLSNSLYKALLVIGVVVAAIVGTILGIQFITGSVEQKSKVKESLIPYVIGCVVIFGAFGIWRLVVTVLGQIA